MTSKSKWELTRDNWDNQENLWQAVVMRIKPRLTEINQENLTANKIK